MPTRADATTMILSADAVAVPEFGMVLVAFGAAGAAAAAMTRWRPIS